MNSKPKIFCLTLVFLIASYFCFEQDNRSFAIADQSNGIFRYTVRGIVRQLRDPENVRTKFLIDHEEIPDYTDESGAKVGMAAMTMPFSVKENSLLSGLQVGDKIEFVLESWWKPRPGDAIVSIRKVEYSFVFFVIIVWGVVGFTIKTPRAISFMPMSKADDVNVVR